MSEAETARIDVWLWRARFFKTRGAAARYARDGRIRLGDERQARRLTRASALVRVDDVLTFVRRERIMCLRIAALGERRGPPAEARSLYEIVEASE